MAEEYGQVTFKGKSGKEYKFWAYSLDRTFIDEGGVYVMAKRYAKDGRWFYKVLYIGETDQLKTRLANHEKWECVVPHGCNCICAHKEDNEQARLDEETDLRHYYTTPCNDQ